MTDSNDRTTMQGTAFTDAEEWAMPERRERAVMRDVPERRSPEPAGDDFRFPTPRGVLSKAEIEALLRPNLPKINDEEDTQAAERDPLSRPLEQKAPVNVDAHKRLAARLTLLFAQATGLKASFRYVSGEAFEAFDTLRAAENDDMAAYVCFGRGGETISHVLEVPGALADALISHACGGAANVSGQDNGRQLSAIDCALLEQLLAPLRGALGPETGFIGVETDRQYVASLAPDQAGEDVQLRARLADDDIDLRLAVLEMPDAAPSHDPAPEHETRKRPVTAVLTARMASLSVPVSRLSSLKPGDTLLLGLPADQPVELLSGGRDGVRAFEGDIGRKGNNMAIRIRKAFTR
ncbi:flagellar motor switch protein FliM [Henriciella sp.]|uniref:FliM/FliN family flagellar motor switch protein n=1 Tax=Henriciella sp. TaxID=1968823 RepID=UPI0026054A50|nr:flagellar motor switch protein FliM [Henriciella sp.]